MAFINHVRIVDYQRRRWTSDDEAARKEHWLRLDAELIARGLGYLATFIAPTDAELAMEPESLVLW